MVVSCWLMVVKRKDVKRNWRWRYSVERRFRRRMTDDRALTKSHDYLPVSYKFNVVEALILKV